VKEITVFTRVRHCCGLP